MPAKAGKEEKENGSHYEPGLHAQTQRDIRAAREGQVGLRVEEQIAHAVKAETVALLEPYH